ncbi:aspartyl-phosphate phosphatase Spo0E family protein [Bacillus sp. HMF5848]|uniref:aspartyl-phosphate phosphatase Spo0E family protein n=1 Tax=Bacillus sp. HMF5848 TaxID=2495421 RepID=UPI000F7879F4|nr:aspartyl-phosphate phosphatase Spo0E family protein [Bacillus sp. HMF5848]RSK28332.1 aspartyl-phosphate phosphatase Spo0E family protein [Bacillus sp. HMF5848]
MKKTCSHLEAEIRKARERLIETGLREGLTSRKTLKFSRYLDKLINYKMKKRYDF